MDLCLLLSGGDPAADTDPPLGYHSNPSLTLPLFSAATLCAASLAMALATLSEMSVPLGWGRILCGEGERRLVGGGGSREWLWMEEGEQVGL